MKTLTCGRCGQRVFFENTGCDACGAALGFVPAELDMAAFEIDAAGAWQRLGAAGPRQRPCRNYAQERVCNWMVAAEAETPLCLCCRSTQVIPALDAPGNRERWARIEQAKRRLFYSLLFLNLPAPSKDEDPQHGLCFQFLEELGPHKPVLTGHDHGLITLNIAEADDAQRERLRAMMHEPYRTLLGHFRHEIGHYYWDRLVAGSPWIDEYRDLFGDERADYAQALQQHYEQPLGDWPRQFISAYASAHPWEDWAECWAHYLHVVDGLETAAAWGLHLHHPAPGAAPLRIVTPDRAASTFAPALVEQWLPVSQFINAMDRSLGTQDSYPFVVPATVIQKLEFIHKVVGAAVRGEVTMRFGGAPDQAGAG